MVKLHWDVSPFRPRSLYCAFHPRIIPESNPAGWIPQHASLILRGGFGKACSTVVFYCEGHAAAKKKKSNQKHKPLQKVTTTWHTGCLRPVGRDAKSTESISSKQKKKKKKKSRSILHNLVSQYPLYLSRLPFIFTAYYSGPRAASIYGTCHSVAVQ